MLQRRDRPDARGRTRAAIARLILAAPILATLAALAIVAASCSTPDPAHKTVVVYTSVDQHYSEPIFRAFEKQTGIRVLAVGDVEAAKTTGLVNRLLAERRRPKADVFWNNEFVQTLLLEDRGVLAPYVSPGAADIPAACRDPDGHWTAFAGRARVLIVNTDLLAAEDRPSSIEDLASPKWPASQVVMAMPLFGTTATHAAALYAAWGPDKAREFFGRLKARGVAIAPGNADVRDLVADGRALWGVTDTDDAAGAVARGAHVALVVPDQHPGGMGALVVPNTVSMIAGAPHPDEARALIDYLVSREVERRLVELGWCHVPVREVGAAPQGLPPGPIRRLDVSPAQVYEQLGRVQDELPEVFVK